MDKNTLGRAQMAFGRVRLSSLDKLPAMDLRQRFTHALSSSLHKGSVSSKLETRSESIVQAPSQNDHS